MIIKANIDSLEFPNELSCDAPIVTFIVYHNNKRIYLRSMFPPAKVQALITYLKNLALDNSLTKVKSIEAIEK